MTPPETIFRALSGWRFDVTNEVDLQQQIAQALSAAKVGYEKEKILGPSDRVDFLCAGGCALEIKVQGSAKKVYRQISRYCEYPEVKCVVLATARTFRMPEEISGKKIYVLSLSRNVL